LQSQKAEPRTLPALSVVEGNPIPFDHFMPRHSSKE
jgi:hypothetical protein